MMIYVLKKCAEMHGNPEEKFQKKSNNKKRENIDVKVQKKIIKE